jgi:hypothetical protein
LECGSPCRFRLESHCPTQLTDHHQTFALRRAALVALDYE